MRVGERDVVDYLYPETSLVPQVTSFEADRGSVSIGLELSRQNKKTLMKSG